MLYNANLNYNYSSVRRVIEKKVSRKNIGLPVRSVEVSTELVCTNAKSFRDTLPDVNPDQLEIDLATGQRLERVNSSVLSPDRIDHLNFDGPVSSPQDPKQDPEPTPSVEPSNND